MSKNRPAKKVTELSLADQVLVALRPDVAQVVTRRDVTGVQAVAAIVAAVGAVVVIDHVGVFLLLAAASITCAILAIGSAKTRRALPENPEKPGSSRKHRDSYRISSGDLRTELTVLKDMPQIPGHHWGAQEREVETMRRESHRGRWSRRGKSRDDVEECLGEIEDDRYRFYSESSRELVLTLVRDSDDQTVLSTPLGEVDDLNRLQVDRGFAQKLLTIGAEAVEFFKATDAFTRPALRPEAKHGERMKVKAETIDYYLVDHNTAVRSPKLQHVSHETSVVCWGPWREDYHRHQSDIALREMERESQTRAESSRKELQRRRAHLERIEVEAAHLRALEGS